MGLAIGLACETTWLHTTTDGFKCTCNTHCLMSPVASICWYSVIWWASHPTSREGLMNGVYKLYVQPPLELHVKVLSHCTVSLVPSGGRTEIWLEGLAQDAAKQSIIRTKLLRAKVKNYPPSPPPFHRPCSYPDYFSQNKNKKSDKLRMWLLLIKLHNLLHCICTDHRKTASI